MIAGALVPSSRSHDGVPVQSSPGLQRRYWYFKANLFLKRSSHQDVASRRPVGAVANLQGVRFLLPNPPCARAEALVRVAAGVGGGVVHAVRVFVPSFTSPC